MTYLSNLEMMENWQQRFLQQKEEKVFESVYKPARLAKSKPAANMNLNTAFEGRIWRKREIPTRTKSTRNG
jgi:hypothetical protein